MAKGAAGGSICGAAVQIKHPQLDLALISTTEWKVRQTMKVLFAALSLAGITGMYLRQVTRTGAQGLVGYLMLARDHHARRRFWTRPEPSSSTSAPMSWSASARAPRCPGRGALARPSASAAAGGVVYGASGVGLMMVMQFETLLEAVPDALVGMDHVGGIQFVNHQTESLFGYHRDDLVGQPIQTLVPQNLW